MENLVTSTPLKVPKLATGKGPVKVSNFLEREWDSGLIDTRNVTNGGRLADLPSKVEGIYYEDYDILYVDDLIRKRLQREQQAHLQGLKEHVASLLVLTQRPQVYNDRVRVLQEIATLRQEIADIESGAKLARYRERVRDIIGEYQRCSGKVGIVLLNEEQEVRELSPETRRRLCLIEDYLEIARDYIQVSVVRRNRHPNDNCTSCGISLAKVVANEEGTIRCPNTDCRTEHGVMIMTRLANDGDRLTAASSTEDESIENFIRAFMRYQCLQPERPDSSLYRDLDEYFANLERPTKEEIRAMPLNERGLRGDTNHKMLLCALAQTGWSEHYEDVNLIGHLYFGWAAPDVMHYRERIMSDYAKTQSVFYQIPAEERCRTSSLGTQYRLWRHLQLVGHECYMEEFKIAENPDSLRNHNRLWRLMCEGANDPNIRYIS